jgi:hypothetical protein
MISEQTNPDQSDLAREAAKTAEPRSFDQSVRPRERRSGRRGRRYDRSARSARGAAHDPDATVMSQSPPLDAVLFSFLFGPLGRQSTPNTDEIQECGESTYDNHEHRKHHLLDPPRGVIGRRYGSCQMPRGPDACSRHLGARWKATTTLLHIGTRSHSGWLARNARKLQRGRLGA